MSIKIVTDSSANIFSFPGLDLQSVPLRICTDQKEYVDNEQLNLAGMIADLKEYKGKSSTACPGIGDWMDAYEGADQIIALAITSGLSGSYNAAVAAADEYTAAHPEAKVFVMDTLSTGPEMVLMIEKIKDCLDAGMDFDRVCGEMKAYLAKTHLFFSLESVNNFARNGRISPAIAKIIGLLGIRLMGKASDQGTLQMLHKCKGEKKSLATIWEEMKAIGFAGGKVRIAHCNNLPAAKSFTQTIRAQYPDCNVSIHTCNALCSFYAEAGGVLVGFEA